MYIPRLDTIATLTCLNALALSAHRGNWKQQPGRTAVLRSVPLVSGTSVVTLDRTAAVSAAPEGPQQHGTAIA
jgi:hypothetical protein